MADLPSHRVERPGDGLVVVDVQLEGRIGSGFFGGSMSEAVDKAAEEVAEYAIANFK